MTRCCFLTAVIVGCLAGGGIVRSDDERASEGNYSGSLVIEFDRDAADVLAAAEGELSGGQTTAGLTRLQGLLDRPSDVLVPRDTSYVSLWEVANQRISRLPRADLEAYQRIVRGPSQTALEAALNPLDPDALAGLTDRYRHTPVGRQSALLLATLAIDRGDARAASVWAGFLRRHFPAFTLPTAIARWHDPGEAPVEPLRSTDMTSHSWSLDLGAAQAARHALDGALAELNAQALTPILSCRPLIVDQQVIARTLTGLICVDANSGALQWEHPISDHAARLATAPGTTRDPIRTSQVSAVLLRRLIRDSLEDELATDGESVFTIITADRADEVDPEWPANTLRAVDLANGQTRWELAPNAQSSRRSRRRAADPQPARYFLGPPLLDGDELLLPAQHGQSVELVSLDRHSGQVMWSVVVGQVVRDLWTRNKPGLDEPVAEDRERQCTACRLSRSGSRVLLPTGAGAIACIDLAQRRLVWACRYPRRDLSAPAPTAGDETHFREMPTRDAFVSADSWIVGAVGVCSASDADRLLAFDLASGQLLWSRPRRGVLQLIPSTTTALLLIGEDEVTAVRTRDGSPDWTTSIRRPVGRGILLSDQLIIPLSGGQHEFLRVSDGTRILDHIGEDAGGDVVVSMHPPPSMRPIQLRNLHHSADIVLSQSASRLERIAPVAIPETQHSSSTVRRLESLLTPVADWRTAAAPAVSALRQIDSRITLADGLLVRTLEQAGLKHSIEQQAKSLLVSLQRAEDDQNAPAIQAREQQLANLEAHRLYVTSQDGLHTCRLDRWIGLMSEEPPHNRDSAAVTTAQPASWPWPATTPRVSEHPTNFGLSYLHSVPVHDPRPGIWSDVTIEVDRQGRMIQLHAPHRARPVEFLLPRSADAYRLEPRFLQAWARGSILLVRVGIELLAFERTQSEELPTSTLWPAEGQTLPLLGTRTPLPTSVRELPDESIAAWHATSAGFDDVFGRRIGDVGPVRDEYFCYQRRGEIVACDVHSGELLWSRARWPIGTRCVGDDQTVVLFHPERPQVTVLDADNGRTLRQWDLDAVEGVPAVSEQSSFAPRQINGSRALILPAAVGPVQLSVLDMSCGEVKWRKELPAGTIDFAIDDSRLGLAVPSTDSDECSVLLLDWESGEQTGRFELAGPADLQAVQTFCTGWQRYVVLSGSITDLPLQNVRQIHDGLHRPLVNGWLHAFDVDATKLHWSQPLENVAFPIVQPRHVPLLVINDMSQPTGVHTPQGRLLCLDARTGERLLEVQQQTHIYYTLDAAPDDSRIDVRLQGRTLRLDYGDETPAEAK